MASIDRVKKLAEELKKKEKDKNYQVNRSMINVSDKANTLKSGGKLEFNIAPVVNPGRTNFTTKKAEERKWFDTGAFDDGYDFGDITKSILGTATDIYGDVIGGAMRVGEGAIDTGAYLVGGTAKLLGNDKLAEETKQFIARDLLDERKAQERATNSSVMGITNNILNGNFKALNPFSEEAKKDDKAEGNSLLGAKTDSLVQSAGQLGATAGLQAVGVPWWLTSGVSSFGGETQNAFQQDATYGQAGISAGVSALGEVLTEKISGGISFGGKTLDKGLKEVLTNKITNKVANTLTKFGIDAAGEGLEEVLSEAISNVGRLSYEDKTLKEALFSEESLDNYLESFIGGAVLGGGANVGRAVNSIKTKTDYETGQIVDDDITQFATEQVNNFEKENGTIDTETKQQLIKEVEQEAKTQLENASNTEVNQEIAPIQETAPIQENTQERINQLEEIKQQETAVQDTATNEQITEQSPVEVGKEYKSKAKNQEVSFKVLDISNGKALIEVIDSTLPTQMKGTKNNVSIDSPLIKGIVQDTNVTQKEIEPTQEVAPVKENTIEQQLENNLSKQIEESERNRKSVTDNFKNYVSENKIDLNDIRDTEINNYIEDTYNDIATPDSNETYLTEEQGNKIKEYIKDYIKENRVIPKGKIEIKRAIRTYGDEVNKPEIYTAIGTKVKINDTEFGIFKDEYSNDKWVVMDLQSGLSVSSPQDTRKAAIEQATERLNELKDSGKTLDQIREKTLKSMQENGFTEEQINELKGIKQETTQVKEQSLDIAPIKAELDVVTNDLKMAIKDTKKELKSLKTDIKDVKATIEEAKALTQADIPMIEQQSNIDSLTDNDIAPITENTTPEYSHDKPGTIESPLDNRDIDEVGNRKVKAYQYENPEVRPYFKTEAESMLGEINDTVKGARMPIYDEVGNMDYIGVTRETTDAIAYLKDNYGYTYAEIEKGLNAIIEDNGKENIAVAKRIEFMLDDRLRNGYTSIDGTKIPANQDYINFLEENNITEYNRATSETLTDEHAPIEEIAPIQFTKEDIIARTKALQESSIRNATENHPQLTDEFIEELTKQNIEMARESGKLTETAPIASNTEVNTNNVPVTEQVTEQPTLKEFMEYEDPVMKTLEKKKTLAIEKTIGETRTELINKDAYNNKGTIVKPKQTFKEKFTKAWDTLQSHQVNRNRQIDKFSKKTRNDEIKFKGDRVNNISGEIGGDIFTAQTDNYGNRIGKSLDSPFESARKEGLEVQFDNYLKHQSNIERHAQGKGSKAVSSDTSKKYVKAYESKYPKFQEWAQDVYTYNQNLLNNAENNGLIDTVFKEVLTGMYGKYVPFYEANSEFAPNVNESIDEIKTYRPIKRARGGSDASLLGVEQAMIQQTYAYKNAIAKNDLYKEIGKSSNDEVLIGADVRNNPTSMSEALYQDENGKYLNYYEDGQQKTVKISDELYQELSRDLEKQIKAIEEKYSLITKPLQKISQIRGQILTTYNPGFIATNPIKDIGDALFNTKNFGKYVKNVITQSTISDSVKGTQVDKYATEFKKLTGKDITSIKDASKLKGEAKQLYKFYQEGTTWNRFITSYGTNSASMEFGDSGVNVSKNKGFLSGIEKANNYMEVFFRYPEFKSALEKGKSFTQALYEAREVTTNFGRGGTVAKAINRNGATFYNTSVQGMDKFFRNFSGENGARGFIGSVAKAVVVGIAPAVLNHMLFGSGEDEDEDYKALPDYVKDNYYLFKTDDGEFIRIPKGRMVSVLGSAARRTLEYASGEENAFEGYLKNASDQIGATNPLKENIFSPLIQAYGSKEGEAWYGGDLVPTRLQKEHAEEQFDEGTDEFSKWLGKQLNISPYKLNYVIDQYSGGFGDLLLPLITEEAKSDGTLLAPIKDKYTVNSIDDNKYVSELYDMSEELEKNKKSANATAEDELKFKYINEIITEMSELYKLKREVQTSDMTKESKYAQVQVYQDMINELAKEGLDNNSIVKVSDNYASVGDEEYYKTAEGEWYSINEKELESLNYMGLTDSEKNSYFGAKTSIYSIRDSYGDKLDNATDDEKTSIYTEQKREIINEIQNTNLDDEGKAYLYDKYYANTDKLNVILTTEIPFSTYLDLEAEDFKADKDEYGETISGSKKDKIMDFIENSNLDYGQKIVLHKTYYPKDDTYNWEIADYVFNNVESYEDKIEILETLGFTIDENGIVHWD